MLIVGLSLITLYWVPSVHAAPNIPAEIMELCRMFGSQIINQGNSSAPVGDIVRTDILGNSRSSGGGMDIGAIECDGDGKGSPDPGPSPAPKPRPKLPPPTDFAIRP